MPDASQSFFPFSSNSDAPFAAQISTGLNVSCIVITTCGSRLLLSKSYIVFFNSTFSGWISNHKPLSLAFIKKSANQCMGYGSRSVSSSVHTYVMFSCCHCSSQVEQKLEWRASWFIKVHCTLLHFVIDRPTFPPQPNVQLTFVQISSIFFFFFTGFYAQIENAHKKRWMKAPTGQRRAVRIRADNPGSACLYILSCLLTPTQGPRDEQWVRHWLNKWYMTELYSGSIHYLHLKSTRRMNCSELFLLNEGADWREDYMHEKVKPDYKSAFWRFYWDDDTSF